MRFALILLLVSVQSSLLRSVFLLVLNEEARLRTLLRVQSPHFPLSYASSVRSLFVALPPQGGSSLPSLPRLLNPELLFDMD